jgi:hypothetical protein
LTATERDARKKMSKEERDTVDEVLVFEFAAVDLPVSKVVFFF